MNKPQQEGQSSSDTSTRRSFLKNSGAAGAALAGVLGARGAFPEDNHASERDPRACESSQLPADFIYLNIGTEGSMPDCVLDKFRQGLVKWAGSPTASYETDTTYGKRQEMSRETVGKFFHVGKNNICLTDNTTMGMSMTLMGLNFRPGDRVVLTNHEHNAIKSPLGVLQARQRLRIITRAFPSAAVLSGMNSSEILDALFPDIPALRGARALCVSHVYPTTGVRLPLKALREKADDLDIPYLIVDGAQAMGMIDLTGGGDRVTYSDFYACPGHKWLNGPPSTGILYLGNADLRPPEFYPVLSQRMSNYADCGDSSGSCFPMAEALQVRGCSNTPGFAAMIRAMQFQQDIGGPAHVEKRILGLSQIVKENIIERSPASIVSPWTDASTLTGLSVFFPFRWEKPQELFTDKKRTDWVVAELLKKNIQVRSIGFPNSVTQDKPPGLAYGLRVSTAVFNTVEQLESFAHALKDVLLRIR